MTCLASCKKEVSLSVSILIVTACEWEDCYFGNPFPLVGKSDWKREEGIRGQSVIKSELTV